MHGHTSRRALTPKSDVMWFVDQAVGRPRITGLTRVGTNRGCILGGVLPSSGSQPIHHSNVRRSTVRHGGVGSRVSRGVDVVRTGVNSVGVRSTYTMTVTNFMATDKQSKKRRQLQPSGPRTRVTRW